jgi:hypothetical protein
MNTITAEFTAQGRFTKFSGKQAIINRLRNGELPELNIGRDEKCQVILIDPETSEAAGCIPPNPSYGDNYDILEAFIDTHTPMRIIATKVCGKGHHYRVRISVTVN